VADVDLVVGPQESENRSRARDGSLEPPEPLDERVVVAPTRSGYIDEHAFTPVALQLLQEVLVRLAAHVDRGIRPVENEPRDSLWMRGGQRQGQLTAFRPAVDRRAIRRRRIHHRQHVIDPLLERLVADTIREPLAALVEDDDPGERSEPLQQVLVGGQLPVELDVRHGARHEHDVARAIAENAVRDVNVAALGVLDA